jgi:plasmid stability protein
MATLYVENVPDDRYEALRSRAKARRRSIAAEGQARLGRQDHSIASERSGRRSRVSLVGRNDP